MHKLLIFAFSMSPFAALCSTEGVLSGETTALTDTVPPTVVCRNGLAANTDNTGRITLYVSDFVHSVSDDLTPSNLIKLAIRKCEIGLPFDEFGNPIQSLTFDCTELGTQCVEIWAIDTTGKGAMAQSYVIVQDNLNACKPGKYKENDTPPSIVLMNGLSMAFNERAEISIPLETFLIRLSDDLTPADQLILGIRKLGTGSGMPIDSNGQPIKTVTFDCYENGTQTVEIWAEDEHGNSSVSYTYILIEDNLGYCQGTPDDQSPIPLCWHGLSTNLSPHAQVSLQVNDFLQNVYDNDTPVGLMAFSICEAGQSSSFPLDSTGHPVQKITFEKDSLSNNMQVDIWAKDSSGHYNYTTSYLYIYENNAENSLAPLTTCVRYWCNGSPISQLDWQIHGNSTWAGEYHRQFSNTAYCTPYNRALHFFGNATVIPKPSSSTPSPAQGVTVFDLALVKRLILGYDDGLSPFAIIAADANRSGTVTSADMLEMRQIILGQKTNFPDDVSWRYIDESYQFPAPQNPFLEPLPESISFYVNLSSSNQVHFRAVKIGDLDCDGVPFGEEGSSQDRGLSTHALSLPDLMLGEGQQAEISFQLRKPGQWSAMQWELRYDPTQVEITDFLTELPSLHLREADMGFASAPGSLRFLWASAESLPLPAGEALFSLRLRALQNLQTSEVFSFGNSIEHLGICNGEQSYVSLEFRSGEKSKGMSTIYPPRPNPATGAVRIPVSLEQPGTIQIELTDSVGRSTWAKHQTLDSGNQWLHIPPEAMPQPGVYFWRAAIGDVSVQGKLLRI